MTAPPPDAIPTPDATTAAALRQLTAVLERENAALAALDFAAVGGLLADKDAALAALSAAPPSSSPALTEPTRTLAALAARNRALLEHAIAVQRRVIALIARAAPPPPDSRYRAPGRRAVAERAVPRTLCARA